MVILGLKIGKSKKNYKNIAVFSSIFSLIRFFLLNLHPFNKDIE